MFIYEKVDLIDFCVAIVDVAADNDDSGEDE